MFSLAVVVTVVAAVKLWVHAAPAISLRLGDSDDAMRLVMVRDLLAGRGWFDQKIMRLQPPHGVYMHWSRLLDGALAAYDLLLRAFVSPQTAEWLMRATWPLLWLLPAVAAGLAITRRLGGGMALTAGALLFTFCAYGYGQFAPGRIDHHNVQIALCVIAAAAAVWSGERWWAAAVAGAATALGLAIGLEALMIDAVIGAALALRFLVDRSRARAVMAYGLALGLASVAVFLIQTPPGRWGLAVCDAMGVNLVLGLAAAGFGLVAAVYATRKATAGVRTIATAGAGLFAAAIYLSLDPSCRAGPMASVDPSLRSIWFDSIDEMQPLHVIAAHDFGRAAPLAAPAVLGLIAWLWIGRKDRSFGWWTIGGCLAMATACMAAAIRASGYAPWFAVPLIAWAVTDLAVIYGRRLLLSAIALATLCSPPVGAFAATALYAATQTQRHAPLSPAIGKGCLDTAAFGALAKAQPGVVLAEPDLGSFILATTSHAVLSAPYHRMTWGIRTAFDLLHGSPEATRDQIRAAGVSYIVVCSAHRSREHGSLAALLEARAAPSWLQPISPAPDALQVYRVR